MAVYPNGLTSRPIVTDPFGWRIHPIYGDRRLHGGTDSIGHPAGMNYAPEGGRVSYAGYNGGAGNQVSIDVPGTNRQWRMKHHAWINVSVGQTIARGTPTGPTGTTGDSTGIHCHTELLLGGVLVDPFAWIASNLGGFAGDGTPFPNASTQEGSYEMPMLYGTAAAEVKSFPPDMLRRFPGLVVGKTTWMKLGGSPGTSLNADVTQVASVAEDWSGQLAPGAPSGEVIIGINWAGAVERYGWAMEPVNIGATIEVGEIPAPVIDNSALIAAIKENTDVQKLVLAEVRALPAEIDRYADGKKQS